MNQPGYLIDMMTDRMITQSLEEDLGSGDITTNAVVDLDLKAKAVWVSKEDGVICGLPIAKQVFQKLDPGIEWNPSKKEGDEVNSGDEIVNFNANCRAILSAERTALNFVQRMSGIASQTRLAVNQLEGCKTKILDTRKTVPCLRALDKYAVLTGGGKNHRMGLFDMAMVKDNHIVAAGGIMKAVQRIREKNPDVKIEVEVTTLDQVAEALKAKADFIMLDNMEIEMMKQAVKTIAGRAVTEASGNVTIEKMPKIAQTGVDYISSGALTHSVKAFDISQRILKIYH